MGLRCLHTSIFIETPSLEGLPTKANEDPSPYEMRLSPAGHQSSISWSRGFITIIIIINFIYSQIIKTIKYMYISNLQITKIIKLIKNKKNNENCVQLKRSQIQGCRHEKRKRT